MSLPDWTIASFRGFWDLVAKGQEDTEIIEQEQVLSSFSDFWTMIASEMSRSLEQDDAGFESDTDSGSETGSGGASTLEEEFLSLEHFARMYVLEAEQ